MNNCSQLLEQAENLKKELSNGRNGLSSDGSGTGEWISSRTSLQDVYRQLLITNLEYALDKKIEQDLWNYVFKNHITALQQQVKDKSNNFRVEAQSHLTAFLDAASGFYAHLLDDLCNTFQINIPCRVKASKLVFLKDSSSIQHSSITQPERPSCQYMCQHCLVHLGDIARYRNQNGQADSYYRHAAQLVPSNGQPYNQLAILAAASGDVLSTAFYYCRSLAVKYPFPGSDTNLRRQLSKIMAGEEPRHTKISTSELIKFCLKFHACIYLKKNGDDLSGMVERLASYIRAHLRAGSLSRQQITHMAFLTLFSLHHLAPNGVDTEGNPITSGELSPSEEKPKDEKKNLSWQALLTFSMHMLGGLLACVPVHSDDVSDLEHPALPGVKIILDWLTSNSTVLHRKEITISSRVWPRLAKVLNALGCQDKANNLNNKPLPEDLELRGFVGLKQPLSKLDFVSGIGSSVQDDMEHSCRSYRLFELGLCISTINNNLLSTSEENAGTIFGSSIAPSPQHGAKVNGVEEQSEIEETNTEEDEQEEEAEEEISGSPSRQGSKAKDVRLMGSNVPPRRNPSRGVLKPSDDHRSLNRKNNKAPRMQNVAVQIKPENKLKAIKEEEGGNVDGFNHGEGGSESGGLSNESSQGDGTSPNTAAQPRSVHRVTFAPRVHMSPTQQLNDEPNSPSTAGPNYMEPVGVVIPTVYADNNARLIQQTINRNMHLGPIYHQNPSPSVNPILTAPYGNRNLGPFGYPQNVLARPHIPVQHLQQQPKHNPLGSTPPHPAELPKPMFTGPNFSHLISSEGYPNPGNQMSASPSEGIQRPNDLGFLLPQGPQTLPSPQDQSPTQRNLAQMFLQARYSRTMPPGVHLPHPVDYDAASDFRLASGANPSQNQAIGNRSVMDRQRLDYHLQQLRAQQSSHGVPPQKIDMPEIGSFDLSSERNRKMYPFMAAASGNLHGGGGGSNDTSSASSPTPASLSNMPNHSISPQAGSIGNMNYSAMMNPGFSNVLNDSSSVLEAARRPSSLIGCQRNQPPGFVGSPSQKVTPTGLNHFLAEQQAKQQAENRFAHDNHAGSGVASMFGISPSAANNARPFSQTPSSTQPSDDFPFNVNQQRMKTLFEESQKKDKERLNDSQFKSLLAQQSLISEKPPGLLNSDKDSYKLFPDTRSPWDVSRGSNEENSLGLSGLGTIGGERHQTQFNPWSGLPASTTTTGSSSLPESSRSDLLTQRSLAQETMMPPRSSNEDGSTSQSFWSTPMMPSGPSALEQLIMQQQTGGRERSPP